MKEFAAYAANTFLLTPAPKVLIIQGGDLEVQKNPNSKIETWENLLLTQQILIY